jgi:hypothetical protein
VPDAVRARVQAGQRGHEEAGRRHRDCSTTTDSGSLIETLFRNLLSPA